MPALFEKLMTRLLVEAASDVVVSSRRSLPLDHDQRLTIRPDVIISRDRADIAVADLKYKVLDENGAFHNADAYQLITYCIRLGLDTGHLIYAASVSHRPLRSASSARV